MARSLVTTFSAKGSNVVEKVVFVEAGFSPASCPPEGGLYDGSPKALCPPEGGLYEGSGRVCINGISPRSRGGFFMLRTPENPRLTANGLGEYTW